MRFLKNGKEEVLLHMPLATMVCTAAFPKYTSGSAHGGTDWRCTVGTPVYAAEDGVCRWVQKWDGRTKVGNMSYGNAVIIKHNNYRSTHKLETVYAHLNQLNVTTNQVVKEGDIIGWSGNTGNSFGAHLHFEVRYDGVKVQPLSWLGGNFTFASDAVKRSCGKYESVVVTAQPAPVTQPVAPAQPSVTYFQKYTGTSTSISAALKAIGVDGSYSYRSKIAAKNNIANYNGTAAQNTQMLNLLKQGKLIKP